MSKLIVIQVQDSFSAVPTDKVEVLFQSAPYSTEIVPAGWVELDVQTDSAEDTPLRVQGVPLHDGELVDRLYAEGIVSELALSSPQDAQPLQGLSAFGPAVTANLGWSKIAPDFSYTTDSEDDSIEAYALKVFVSPELAGLIQRAQGGL